MKNPHQFLLVVDLLGRHAQGPKFRELKGFFFFFSLTLDDYSRVKEQREKNSGLCVGEAIGGIDYVFFGVFCLFFSASFFLAG